MNQEIIIQQLLQHISKLHLEVAALQATIHEFNKQQKILNERYPDLNLNDECIQKDYNNDKTTV